MKLRTWIVSILGLLIVAITSAGALGQAYYSSYDNYGSNTYGNSYGNAISPYASGSSFARADPYDGVNRIGTYYQYSNTIAYDYQQVPYQAYDYIAPPRAGGWFGSGTEWLVGLRSPVYTPVAPTHYTNYYQPVYGYPDYFGGGYGYPRSRASDFPIYRERIGGIFSY